MITKEDFDELYDVDIRHKDYIRIIEEINSRVDEIIQFVSQPYKKNNAIMYCYSNGNYDNLGTFDPIEYKDNFVIHLYQGIWKKPFDKYFNGIFPSKWLYQDFKPICKNISEIYEKELMMQDT